MLQGHKILGSECFELHLRRKLESEEAQSIDLTSQATWRPEDVLDLYAIPHESIKLHSICTQFASL